MSSKLKEYGYNEFYERQLKELNISDERLSVGRVIEVQKDLLTIITEYGEKHAKLKGSLFYNNKVYNEYPTVGDFIIIKHNENGDDVIYKVLKRKSKFSRMDSFNEIEQLVACNFDYVCIMSSLNYDFNLQRIERYLSIAWESGAVPIILLTKSDLCSDSEEKRVEVEGVAPGVKVIVISSINGEGIDEFKGIIKKGETIVFLGSSGVGKSTLVNTLAGEQIMKVNGIREIDSKGRHTTTHRQLIMLKNGTMIIDTPGMRELQMWVVNEGLDNTFSEIEEIAKGCRFRDCTHEHEPGCAVKEALENGKISKERWKNYLKLKREIRFAEIQQKSRQRDMAKMYKELKTISYTTKNKKIVKYN